MQKCRLFSYHSWQLTPNVCTFEHFNRDTEQKTGGRREWSEIRQAKQQTLYNEWLFSLLLLPWCFMVLFFSLKRLVCVFAEWHNRGVMFACMSWQLDKCSVSASYKSTSWDAGSAELSHSSEKLSTFSFFYKNKLLLISFIQHYSSARYLFCETWQVCFHSRQQ